MEREITLKEQEKAKKLLSDKDDLVKQGRDLTKQIEKLEKDRAKVGHKIQAIKDKLTPIIENEKIELGEFEYINRIDKKKDKVVVYVRDRVEDYKEQVRKKMAEGEQSEE